MRWRGTVPFGLLRGVPVRLHWFFLLFWGLEFLRPLFFEGTTFLASAIAIASVCAALFLREHHRISSAERMGLEPLPIVLGPFGSLDEAAAVRAPTEQRLLSLTGFIPSLAIVLLLGVYVLATDQWNSYLFRFQPVGASLDPLAIFWGVQFDLLVLHLLPSFPFDGGRLFHALVWDRTDEETALSKVVLSSRFCAVGCLLAGLFGSDHAAILVWVGLFCFIAGEVERRSFAERSAEPDWLGAGEYDREGKRSKLSRWLEERRSLADAQQRESAARERVAEEAELDALLEKVHVEGLESLSRRERRFLARVGKKYRDRSAPAAAPSERDRADES